jgi:hypothetical protein
MENWLIFQYPLQFRWGDAEVKLTRGIRNSPFKYVVIGLTGKSVDLDEIRKYMRASARLSEVIAAEKNL